jgi:hypothetical protein
MRKAAIVQRIGPSANKRAKFQVGHKNVQELVIFLSFLHFDSCISLGTDFQRFIRLLLASDR